MPPKRHRRESEVSRKRYPARNKKSSRAFMKELCVGCILWLPEQVAGGESVECIMPQCRCGNSELEPEGYKHYVVILDIFRRDNGEVKCYVAKLTSQVGTGRCFLDRLKISQEFSASASDKQNDEQNEIHFEHGSMPKQSYISLNHAFRLSPKILQPIKTGNHACDRRLSERSYMYLMMRIGLKAGIYEDTNLVRQFGATIHTENPETQLSHLAYSSTESIVAPTEPLTILTLPNSITELGPSRPQDRIYSPSHGLPTTQVPVYQNSALEQHDSDHEALRRACMLSPQSSLSRNSNSTPQLSPNHSIRPANKEINTSQHYLKDIAQRPTSETDSLFQRYEAQRREHERIQARDLERCEDGESNGSSILSRCLSQCTNYLLGGVIYAVENAPWKRLGWFSVIVFVLYYMGILKVGWLAVKGLGEWLKVAGVWTGSNLWKLAKVLGPWLKNLGMWSCKAIFAVLKFLWRGLKGLAVRVGSGMFEPVKNGSRYLGFG